MTFTADQIADLKKGEPVRLSSPELGEDLIVLRASTYEELRELAQDEQEKRAWADLARKARDSWARENPY